MPIKAHAMDQMVKQQSPDERSNFGQQAVGGSHQKLP